MRIMIPHVHGPMSWVPTRKDGIYTRNPDQTPILSCSDVEIPLVK